MLALHVTVPIACFRKGLAREYLETEAVPPPATCYGFLLSLVGEADRHRHVGCRVTPGLIGRTNTSVVLRTVWRVKDRGTPQGSGTNARPDYQQLLTGDSPNHPFVELVVWLDSAGDQSADQRLEDRVRAALDPARRHAVSRFGGLSFGESTHMVDSVSLLDQARSQRMGDRPLSVFEVRPNGRLTLPVWVDHVGSRGTRYATGTLTPRGWADPPPIDSLPVIRAD
jgi:CRISPR-associated protein Cas5t